MSSTEFLTKLLKVQQNVVKVISFDTQKDRFAITSQYILSDMMLFANYITFHFSLGVYNNPSIICKHNKLGFRNRRFKVKTNN